MFSSSGADAPLVLDRQSIQMFCIDICDGDVEIIAELVEMYLKSLDELIDQMEVALRTEDHKLLRRASHTLKSSSRVFGAEALSANCERLEGMARAGVLDGASQLIEQIGEQGRQMHQMLPTICQNLPTEC